MEEGPKRKGFEFKDHVADVRIKAWGDGLEETFVAVTTAVWRYVLGEVSVPKTRSWEVQIEGQDIEDILVSFINEQVFLYESEGFVLAAIRDLKVHAEHGAFRLQALFEGCLLDETPVLPERHIKAATYHDLVVKPGLIEVTLDV